MSSYLQSLSSAPGSCADIRQELKALLGLKVSGTTYNALWKNLELHLGHDGAVSFVDDFVDYRQKRKMGCAPVECILWHLIRGSE